jgi:hypothetical protein
MFRYGIPGWEIIIRRNRREVPLSSGTLERDLLFLRKLLSVFHGKE